MTSESIGQMPGDLELRPQVKNLLQRLNRLNDLQLGEVKRLLSKLESNSTDLDKSAHLAQVDWPHAPVHRLSGKGTFIVTSSTLYKRHLFWDAWSLDMLQAMLLHEAKTYSWQLEAWACFSNHFHFVGHALEDASSLIPFLSKLHAESGRQINERDDQPSRQVWFNYWDTQLTFQNSYLARLNYVHQNPVRHGLVPVANQYRWCSAAWFERSATSARVKTIYGF